jgi:hypothetical protein
MIMSKCKVSINLQCSIIVLNWLVMTVVGCRNFILLFVKSVILDVRVNSKCGFQSLF